MHLKKRKKAHIKNAEKGYRKGKFQRAIRKYGIDNFVFCVLKETCPLLRVQEENYYIDKYNSIKNGYNCMYADNNAPDESARANMRAAQQGKTVSEETKRKISKTLSGKNHPCYGKKASKETNDKRSKSMAEYWTDERRAEWSVFIKSLNIKGMTGKKHSKKTKNKMSESIRKYWGENRDNDPRVGIKRSEATKNKMSVAKKKWWTLERRKELGERNRKRRLLKMKGIQLELF